MSDPYPLLTIFSFFGFVLPLFPLPWHLEASNSGTCFYMIWSSLASLNMFVNSIVWHGNALNVAPVWCDISTRIIIASSVAIPAASLCINRRLYNIARLHAVGITQAEKRRAVLVDSCICVLFPLLCLIFYYIVQGHRFDILEDIGCYPVVYDTIPAYFLVSMWPIVLGLISAAYCVLSIRAFLLRRNQFDQFLSSNSALTKNRYFRLMALSTTELLCTTPIATYLMYLNATTSPTQPWISWADTHYDFSRVEQIPSLIWRMDGSAIISFELTRWSGPICGIIFFLFFGFADEARRHYRKAFMFALQKLGIKWEMKAKGPKLFTSSNSRPSGKFTFYSSSPASPPVYTPLAPKHRLHNTSVGSLSDYYFNTPEKASFKSPTFPEASKTKDSIATQFTGNGSIPLSPTTSEYPPTITELPFEIDRISMSSAYPASRSSSSSYSRSPSLELPYEPAPVPAPAFHRPFSPPTIYPVTMPYPGSESDDNHSTSINTDVNAIVVSVRTQSEVNDMV